MPPWMVLAGGDFVYKGAMAIYWVLLARAMSIDDLGVIALANAIGLPAFVIVDAGLNAILVRDYSEAGGLPSSHRRRVNRRILLSILLLPVLAGLGYLLGDSLEAAAATGLISFAYFCDFTGQLMLAPSRAAARMEPDAVVRFIQAGGTVLVSVVFILFDRVSPTWIALASAIAYAVAMFPAWRVWRLSMQWAAHPAEGHHESSDEVAVSQATILMSAFGRADSILVQVLLGPAALAIYTVAYKLIEVARLLPGALSRIILAHASGESSATYDPFRHLRLSLMAASAGAVGVIVLGPTALDLLFGAEYGDASPVQIMGASIIPYAVLAAGSMFAIGTGLASVYRRIALESLAVLVVSVVVLSELKGIDGAALGMLISQLFCAMRFWVTLRPRISTLPET